MLEQAFTLKNGRTVDNRVVIQPMEGCDCLEDGSPSELTKQKYYRNAASGAGMIWFEANAVCGEGRTNPRQMMLTKENKDSFKRLVEEVRERALKESGGNPLLLIQLTHSGRQSMKPMIAYRNAIYEKKRPVTDENVVSDEYLDSLPELFARGARLAAEVGFDGVDVKSCHGYLMQEMLSGYLREGRYGGSFENRTRLYFNCFDAVKSSVENNFVVASRLGLSDMVPYPYGFGTTKEGELDLKEGLRLVALAEEKGLCLLNVTVGNPYYNPHINRPFRKGPYQPEEPAEVGLKRFERVERELKNKFPSLAVVASGLSYYRDNLMEKAEALLSSGACDFVGFGRESLAYPDFYRDYAAGKFDKNKCCVTCSRCTELMRNKQVSGCAVFGEYYKELYRKTVASK